MEIHSRAKKAELSPGTPVHIGKPRINHPVVSVFRFSPSFLRVDTLDAAAKIDGRTKGDEAVAWIDTVGLHDTTLLEQIGQSFGIHALVVEDIANADHRPKVEIEEDFIFLVIKLFGFGEAHRWRLQVEQLSIVIGPDFLLTFREGKSDVFDSVRPRLEDRKSRIRNSGPDYLAYALMDAVVDSYFGVLDRVGGRIDLLEERVLKNPDNRLPEQIHRLKHDLLIMHKATWPLRETFSTLLRDESSLIRPHSRPFLRDLHDHITHVVETIDLFREMLSGLLEVHFANINNRMSEVIKVLTIIATIFIPLTFIVGVYGMNFEYMPELNWRWGYLAIWLLMFAIAAGLLGFFRYRRWI